MNNSLYMQGISLDDLLAKIDEIVSHRVQQLFDEQLTKPKTLYLKRHEVATILHISLPTLCTWTKLGILKGYKIGNRVLYRQNEVEEALTKQYKYKRVPS